MNNKKVLLLLISLVFIIGLAVIVSAQGDSETFRLTDIFETIEGFDVFEAYSNFSWLIDTFIYFLFFVSIAQVTLGKHFEGKGGKGVVISVGIALAVAITFWSRTVGFTLGSLGPLAGIIFAAVIGIWLYRLLKGDTNAGSGIWITIIIIYISFYMFFPEIIAALQANKWGRLGLAVLSVAFVIALPMTIVSLFKSKDDNKGTFKGLLPGGGGNGNRTPAERREQEEEDREVREEEALIKIDMRTTIDELKLIHSIYGKIQKMKGMTDEFMTNAGSTNWVAEVDEYNNKLQEVRDDLNKVNYFDEQVKQYSEYLYNKLGHRVGRGNPVSFARRETALKNRGIAQRVRREYETTKHVEVLIGQSDALLKTTERVPKICATWIAHAGIGPDATHAHLPAQVDGTGAANFPRPAADPLPPFPVPGVPPAGVDLNDSAESYKLQAVLSEMKRVYDLLKDLFNSEATVSKKLRDL